MWNLERVARLYERARRYRARSGYKYSKTKRYEYLLIKRAYDVLLEELDNTDVSMVDFDTVNEVVAYLSIKIRKIDESTEGEL